MNPTRDWFTINETADDLGLSYHRIYRWVGEGRVWAELAGKGIYLIHRSEIDRVRTNGNKPLMNRRDALMHRVPA